MLCQSHGVPANHTPSHADASKFKLNPPPAKLRYEFLDFDRPSPVTMSSHLSSDETSKVLEKMRIHRGTIGYSIKEQPPDAGAGPSGPYG
jgi:hypothetical protein